jgi:hypothetical protein
VFELLLKWRPNDTPVLEAPKVVGLHVVVSTVGGVVVVVY